MPGCNLTSAFLVSVVAAFVLGCALPGRNIQPTEERSAEKPDFGGVYHVVEKGQTLWRIARTYGIDLETLQWVNDIEDVTQIPVGRKIFVPGARAVLVVVPYRPEEEKMPPVPALAFSWPLDAKPSSGYGPRGGRKHDGLDLVAPGGTSVKAAGDGKVVYSGQGMKGYGKVIVLKHEGELSTVYAHNSANLVGMGELVRKGQVIAKVGQTGRATGPHLHFEVRLRGVAVDPLPHLQEP